MAVHRPRSLLQTPREVRSLQLLREKKVLAFCGIGNPASFFASLEELGAKVIDTRTWPDHHAYDREDVDWLTSWRVDQQDALLICTVKDWVKIQEPRLGQRELMALVVELEMVDDGAEQLELALHKLLIEPTEHECGSSQTQ
jgi:tetraacyldisaccharide 4'-kinase